MTSCKERLRLLELCAAATSAYKAAYARWQKHAARPNTSAFRASLDAREKARVQVEQATNQLERHEAIHNCHRATVSRVASV